MRGSHTELTPKQKLCILIMCEHLGWSLAEVAREAGVHYNSLYKWNHLEKFQEALDKSLHRVFKDMVHPALDCILTCVKNGDRLAAQYVLDNVGYKLADKVELSTNDIKINITND